MRILVFQLKRIGDTVLTASALADLRASLPEAEIHLLLDGPSGGLAAAFPGLASVHVWRRGRMNLSVLARVLAGRWDMVIDFTGSDRSFSLSFLSRGKQRFAYERHVERQGWRRRVPTHSVVASVRDLTTEDFHRALVASSVKLSGRRVIEARAPYLDIPPEMVPQGLPSRYAVIHPGTARDEKYWTTEGWIAVARALIGKHGVEVVMTGSGDAREESHLAPIRHALGDEILDLAGQLDLIESAAVLSQATVLVSVDSAAMHLAAQFAVPQVALFGPTNPYHWAPRHSRACLFLGGTGKVVVEELSPKYVPGEVGSIAISEVTEAVDELLR